MSAGLGYSQSQIVVHVTEAVSICLRVHVWDSVVVVVDIELLLKVPVRPQDLVCERVAMRVDMGLAVAVWEVVRGGGGGASSAWGWAGGRSEGGKSGDRRRALVDVQRRGCVRTG